MKVSYPWCTNASDATCESWRRAESTWPKRVGSGSYSKDEADAKLQGLGCVFRPLTSSWGLRGSSCFQGL